MFPFLAWFCSLPRVGKALVDDCGLKLQTRWRGNAPKREKFNFRLPSMAQKRLCLSSETKLKHYFQVLFPLNSIQYWPFTATDGLPYGIFSFRNLQLRVRSETKLNHYFRFQYISRLFKTRLKINYIAAFNQQFPIAKRTKISSRSISSFVFW